MNNLNEAIKFIKDKLEQPEIDNNDWYKLSDLEHILDLEHIKDLLIKTKQDFKNIQHKSYRIERDE